MAKRSAAKRHSEWVEDKLDPLEQEHPKAVKEPEPETVLLVLLKNVNLKTKGPITGREYVFPGGGAKVNVDKRDAEEMLKRGSHKSCCGSRGSPYFDLA